MILEWWCLIITCCDHTNCNIKHNNDAWYWNNDVWLRINEKYLYKSQISGWKNDNWCKYSYMSFQIKYIGKSWKTNKQSKNKFVIHLQYFATHSQHVRNTFAIHSIYNLDNRGGWLKQRKMVYDHTIVS